MAEEAPKAAKPAAPGFAVEAFAPLAKIMPREEYMKMMMQKFQEAKRGPACGPTQQQSGPSHKKKPKKEPLVAPDGYRYEYQDDLRQMLHAFGCARDADPDVLKRLELVARAYLAALLEQLAALAARRLPPPPPPQQAQRPADQAASARADKAAKEEQEEEGEADEDRGKEEQEDEEEEDEDEDSYNPKGRRRRKSRAKGAKAGSRKGASTSRPSRRRAAKGEEPLPAPPAAPPPTPPPPPPPPPAPPGSEAEAGGERVAVRLEHLAAALQDPGKVQRLAELVLFLRRHRLEKARQSLADEADAEGDLFPKRMLQAAAAAASGAAAGASAGAAASALLTEPFWAAYGCGGADGPQQAAVREERLRRLSYRDELSRALSAEDYLHWVECAKVSFTKPHKRKKFVAWCEAVAPHLRLSLSKELADVLGQFTYEHVEALVTQLVARGPERFRPLPLSDLLLLLASRNE